MAYNRKIKFGSSTLPPSPADPPGTGLHIPSFFFSFRGFILLVSVDGSFSCSSASVDVLPGDCVGERGSWESRLCDSSGVLGASVVSTSMLGNFFRWLISRFTVCPSTLLIVISFPSLFTTVYSSFPYLVVSLCGITTFFINTLSPCLIPVSLARLALSSLSFPFCLFIRSLSRASSSPGSAIKSDMDGILSRIFLLNSSSEGVFPVVPWGVALYIIENFKSSV
nr:unnamed protein product [Callosobruchus analis]